MDQSNIDGSPGRRYSLHALACCVVMVLVLSQIGGGPATNPAIRTILAGSAASAILLGLAGLAIARLAAVRSTLTRKLQEADEVQRVSSRVTSSNTMQQAAGCILAAFRQTHPYTTATLLPISAEPNSVMWHAATDGTADAAPCEFSAGQIAEMAVRDAEYVRCQDFAPGLQSLVPGCRSAAVVPISLPNGTVTALLVAGFAAIGRPSPPDIHWFDTFGRGVALPLERVRIQEELARLAYTDPMTGLANQRAFQSQLHDECDRAARYGNPLSLLFLDIDRFKGVNDTHGHPAGDEVLKHVADILRCHVRSIDLPARYGGEEFAVICPNTEMDAALVLAERLRSAVEESVCTLPTGEKLTITLSIGAASHTMQAWCGSLLVEKADTALYRAKRTGRNRVVTADPVPGSLLPARVFCAS